MIDLVLDAYKKNKIIAVYSNYNYPDTFTVGRIIGMDDDSILVEELNYDGAYDGYSVINLSSVFRIETESKYIKRIELLNQDNTRTYKQIELKKINTVSIIDYCVSNNSIINLRIFESDIDIFGFVVCFDTSLLEIKQVSTDGEFDGFSTIEIERIEHIATQRVECQCIKNLFVLRGSGDKDS